MKKILLFFLLALIVLASNSQTADFYADSTGLYTGAGSIDSYTKVMEMQWQINGKTLSFGSKPVRIKPNPKKLDTVLFMRDNTSGWDTIICNISQAGEYRFEFNPCCGGFKLKNIKLNKFPIGRLCFIRPNNSVKYYLGRLGETGALLHKPGNDTIEPQCRSAMQPNVYTVTLEEIVPCKGDSSHCESVVEAMGCLYNAMGRSYDEDDNPDYYFLYRYKATLLDFKYMPLDNKVLKIIFNEIENTFEIK